MGKTAKYHTHFPGIYAFVICGKTVNNIFFAVFPHIKLGKISGTEGEQNTKKQTKIRKDIKRLVQTNENRCREKILLSVQVKAHYPVKRWAYPAEKR